MKYELDTWQQGAFEREQEQQQFFDAMLYWEQNQEMEPIEEINN